MRLFGLVRSLWAALLLLYLARYKHYFSKLSLLLLIVLPCWGDVRNAG
jgi:hypothetical protein